MSGAVAATLPSGFWCDATHHREAWLRPLTGGDEVELLEDGAALLPAERATHLLTRCLVRLGSVEPVTTETVRALTIGDREALMLHLRRLTLGDRIPCVLTCPAPECGEKLDLDLRASELLLPPYPEARAWYTASLEGDGAAYEVRFRLPTGADQEAAARLAVVDPEAGAALLLQRCVDEITSSDHEPVDDLPAAIASRLPATMAELDQQADLRLEMSCPACDGAFSAVFDATAYVLQELAGGLDQLYREVHLLALSYHWGEAEIMAMPPRKRRRYLDLLTEALTEEGQT